MQDLKNNKRSGEDQLTAEMIKAGENISVSMLHNLLKEIWKSKQVPQDWKNSVVIPIFKKRDKTECTNYRGISLLSVPGKILSRILYNCMSVLGDIFLRDGQCGFRKKRSTIDMIFAARQLVEKAIEQKTGLSLAFIDISKAFDSVSSDVLFKILDKLKCSPTLLSLLMGLYDNTFSKVRVDGELLPLAPFLFLICMQVIIFITMEQSQAGVEICYRTDTNLFCNRNLRARRKVNIAKLQELMFADDCAVTAESPEDLQLLVNAFSRAANDFGLKVSVAKIEVMFVNCQPQDIVLNISALKGVDTFKYIGSLLTSYDDITTEIENHLKATNQAFGRLSLKTKLMVYKTAVLSTLLNSAECWNLLERHIKKLKAFHLRCLRSILKISWKDYVPNVEVLERANMMNISEILRTRRLR